jgi:hypothetical protein
MQNDGAAAQERGKLCMYMVHVQLCALLYQHVAQRCDAVWVKGMRHARQRCSSA